jgi:hypothetical protein
MRIGSRRLAALARTLTVVAVALTFASPAAAQFGGLKKKLKAAAASDAADQVVSKPAAVQDVPEPGPAAGDGGAVVVDAELVERLIAGLKAAEAERKAAHEQNTPYAKYHRDLAAYEGAQPKCQQGQQTFTQRMVNNPKMADEYDRLVQAMVDAQGKGDQARSNIYSDSAMAMQDPACTVKQPEQPSDYYETHRKVNDRAEKTALKTAGLSRSDYSQAVERIEMVLRDGTPPTDMSADEKKAITSRAAELKPLLGIRDPEKTQKPAPVQPVVVTPAPAPAPPTAAQAASQAYGTCVAQNAQKHEERLEGLGERASAAQEAGNTALMFAIADTIQRLQTAGCTAAR